MYSIYLIEIFYCNVGNNVFYQQLHEKEFALFAPTTGTSFKYHSNNLKELMKHMTTLIGPIFNKNSSQTIAGKYMKLVSNNYHTNICGYTSYEHPRLILQWDWVALLEESKEKNMRKERSFPPTIVETLR